MERTRSIFSFQSTPPARGATAYALGRFLFNYLFQSTPPARGATCPRWKPLPQSGISIHAPPRGGRLLSVHLVDVLLVISIHAPREGGDSRSMLHGACRSVISIHAPREGGDCTGGWCRLWCSNFNPRPPRGGRLLPLVRVVLPVDKHFNPRPPRGGRPLPDPRHHEPCHFNPRPPRGGRRETSS